MSDWLTTDCARCDGERATEAHKESGNLLDILVRRMILCPMCGDKRCPKAAWHENACLRDDPNPAPILGSQMETPLRRRPARTDQGDEK